MAGKHSWYMIRKYLLQTAEGGTTKGASLAGMLYIPESFNAEKKSETIRWRLAQMIQIVAPEKDARHLMLMMREVKGLAQPHHGHKIVPKHLPDCHFMMNDDIYKRLLKKFEMELGSWDALEGTHLMMIGTLSIGATGVTSLEEVTLMCVTENQILLESTSEKVALDALTQQNQHFMRGIWYNLPSTRPLACAVASDTEPEPTAICVVPLGASEGYTAAVDELITESKLPSWEWATGEAPAPALPVLPEYGR